MDADGDFCITANDVLVIVNHLNLLSSLGTSGEGEAPAALLGQAAGGEDLKTVAETPFDLASASLPSPLPNAGAVNFSRCCGFGCCAFDGGLVFGVGCVTS